MSVEEFYLLVLFAALLLGILSGIPVMLVLLGVPLIVSLAGGAAGDFDLTYLQAFPQRVLGLAGNSLLLAIPLFIAMGVLLERSRSAEKMLLVMARLLGGSAKSLAFAVLLVSALIAASTGIIGATIAMLALISLPAMTRAGLPVSLSSGLVCAAGTLGQIIPPSVVLILLGDQVSNTYLEAQHAAGNFAPEPVSVADLFAGALLPGLLLVALYALYIFVYPNVRGNIVDSASDLPRGTTETAPNLSSAKTVHIGVAAVDSILPAHLASTASEETGQFRRAAGIASLDLPENVTGRILLETFFPPLLLILSVLGSILVGVATPTEASAIGAAGALLLAAGHADTSALCSRLNTGVVGSLLLLLVMNFSIEGGIRASSWSMGVSTALLLIVSASLVWASVVLWRISTLFDALRETLVITAMVFGIIIGASMLSLVFRGFGGDEIIERLLTGLPGGEWGALITVMLVVFVLGFVLEFVEIIFIIVPMVGPILLASEFDPVWIAILLAINLQTSFLTPPFGFALFYFRSVAPASLSTLGIYRAVIPFVVLQLLALCLVALFPVLATWLPAKLD